MRQPTQDPSQSTSNLNQPFPFRQRHTACHALRTKYKARVTERESKGWRLLAVCTTRGSSVYAPQLFLSTPRTVPRPPTAAVDGGPQELDSRSQASGSDQTQCLRPAAEQQSSWWRVIHNKMRKIVNVSCLNSKRALRALSVKWALRHPSCYLPHTSVLEQDIKPDNNPLLAISVCLCPPAPFPWFPSQRIASHSQPQRITSCQVWFLHRWLWSGHHCTQSVCLLLLA